MAGFIMVNIIAISFMDGVDLLTLKINKFTREILVMGTFMDMER